MSTSAKRAYFTNNYKRNTSAGLIHCLFIDTPKYGNIHFIETSRYSPAGRNILSQITEKILFRETLSGEVQIS